MLYLILATFFFGITLIFIKLTTARVNPVLSSLLFPVFAAIVQIAVLLFLKTRGVKLSVDRHTLGLIVLGGLALGFYAICLYMAISRLSVSKATPVVYVGAIALASAFGILFLKEPFTWINGAGMLLAFAGLFMLFIR